MKLTRIISFLFLGLCLASTCFGIPPDAGGKKKILVVSSYHREYSWSQETNNGLCAAFLEFGYLDNANQVQQFTKNDMVESSFAIVKKLWMDTKRKNSKEDYAKMTAAITEEAKKFQPDLILLGDDDAARYIGNQFLDTKTPIVFWGVNNTPLKYGLVASMEKPGHNVTGVFQPGNKKESLELLVKLVPRAKTFAVVSDATSAGRNHVKAIEFLAHEGSLPLRLVDTIATNNFEEWKTKILELQKKVDTFFVTQYSGLIDEKGAYVSAETGAAWYLTHVTIPETTDQGQFIQHGMLCGSNDSGVNMGYEAGLIAHDILAKGANPAIYPPRPPKRGPLMINTQRAAMLGISLSDKVGIEEYVASASVLPHSDSLRIMIIDSYHRGYSWAMDTHEGLLETLLALGYLDNADQISTLQKEDAVNSSKTQLRVLWLDAKRKSDKPSMENNAIKLFATAKAFNPDLIFLGDDNAARDVGKMFLDTEIPLVFWGLNNSPVKYGLVDSAVSPGHNATGVYQSGYYTESLKLLKKIVPGARTFAILSDATVTGRSHYKQIEYLARKGVLPFTLVESVSTNNFETWKQKALELQKKVDVFFVAQYSGLTDTAGNYVSNDMVAQWYGENITIPEAVNQKQFVEQGMLCGADDSAFNQGKEAAAMAHEILTKQAKPATYKPRTPKRGALMVNTRRAKTLGIALTVDMGIEEWVEAPGDLQ